MHAAQRVAAAGPARRGRAREAIRVGTHVVVGGGTMIGLSILRPSCGRGSDSAPGWAHPVRIERQSHYAPRALRDPFLHLEQRVSTRRGRTSPTQPGLYP